MRSLHAILLATLLLHLAGCCEEKPSGPAWTECREPAAAPRNGFFLTGSGYNHARANLEENHGGTTSITSSYYNEAPSSVRVLGTTTIGGRDLSVIVLGVRILGFPRSTFHWDDLTEGEGFLGMTLEIATGPAAGIYRGVAGTTKMTRFEKTGDTVRIAGSFCGTLKDSLGRTVTLEGGSFAVGP